MYGTKSNKACWQRSYASASDHRLKRNYLKITFSYNFKNVDSTGPYDHLFQISHVRKILPDIMHIHV